MVLLRSGKPRVFCAGANIRMLAGATHAHKVNFCKFTNETRNGIEDASAASGLKTICVINGTAAGGGYELALAADHIMLVDDGSSAVSLPELPLLAVLPGTGGLTRVTDKRKVRRDHADVFCTTEEGIKGKRAVDWRLVDEVVPGSKLDDGGRPQRAKEFAAKSRARSGAQGHRAHAAQARAHGRTAPNTARSRSNSSARAARHHHPARAGCAAADPPTRWSRRARTSGRCASRASSTTRSSTSASTSSTSPRSCSSRRAIREQVLAYDAFLDANKDHWLAREISALLEARAQARRPHLALAGRAGRAGLVLRRHARRTRVRRRPLLHADRRSARATTSRRRRSRSPR